MASLRLIARTGLKTDVSIQLFFKPRPGADSDIALARAVLVALNTDRLALPDDQLPNSRDDNRRGWWGDLDAQTIWNGWPIGTRLWLLTRSKIITDQGAAEAPTLQLAQGYISEALQPFVDANICSSFDIALSILSGPSGNYGIGGTITLYRGPKSAIALEYEDLWTPYGG